jgi:hypothetical protein
VVGRGVAQAQEEARGVGVAAERLERGGEGLEQGRVSRPFRERGAEGGGRVFVATLLGAEQAEAALLFGREAARALEIEERGDGFVALARGLVEIGELGLDARVVGGDLDGAEEGRDGLVAQIAVGAREAEAGEGEEAIGRGEVGVRGLAVGVDGLARIAGLGVEAAEEEPRSAVRRVDLEVLTEDVEGLLRASEGVQAASDGERARRIARRQLARAAVTGERELVIAAGFELGGAFLHELVEARADTRGGLRRPPSRAPAWRWRSLRGRA